jgi:hypothetical protein
VLLTILLTGWITFTLTRLDRLHARVDAAQAALDAQLVRRAAALRRLVEPVAGAPLTPPPLADPSRIEAVVDRALSAAGDKRQAAENEVGRAIGELAEHSPAPAAGAQPPDAAAGELHEACERVVIARRFYNDAVRDTRTLRAGRMPRALHLAGHRELPQFFDIDDTVTFPGPVATAIPAGRAGPNREVPL